MSEIIQRPDEIAQVSIPQNTAVNIWQNKDAFDQAARVAGMLAKSKIVPENYQGKPEDCLIAVEMAARMNTSPIFIMQNLYVVKGKPSWAGQACMAMITACGKFKNVRHVYTGTKGTENRGCYVEATRISDGEVIRGTEVTLKMAKDEGWMSNSKWRNMPEQMLGYRAASFFARMYCPEAMMGLQTTEEIYDVNPPAMPVPTTKSLEDAIAAENEPTSEAIEPLNICADCGAEIVASGKFTAEKLVAVSTEKYGRPLCVKCGKKAKAEAEKQAYQAAAAKVADEPGEDLAAQLMAEAGE